MKEKFQLITAGNNSVACPVDFYSGPHVRQRVVLSRGTLVRPIGPIQLTNRGLISFAHDNNDIVFRNIMIRDWSPMIVRWWSFKNDFWFDRMIELETPIQHNNRIIRGLLIGDGSII